MPDYNPFIDEHTWCGPGCRKCYSIFPVHKSEGNLKCFDLGHLRRPNRHDKKRARLKTRFAAFGETVPPIEQQMRPSVFDGRITSAEAQPSLPAFFDRYGFMQDRGKTHRAVRVFTITANWSRMCEKIERAVQDYADANCGINDPNAWNFLGRSDKGDILFWVGWGHWQVPEDHPLYHTIQHLRGVVGKRPLARFVETVKQLSETPNPSAKFFK